MEILLQKGHRAFVAPPGFRLAGNEQQGRGFFGGACLRVVHRHFAEIGGLLFVGMLYESARVAKVRRFNGFSHAFPSLPIRCPIKLISCAASAPLCAATPQSDDRLAGPNGREMAELLYPVESEGSLESGICVLIFSHLTHHRISAMKTTAAPPAATLNREIVDDRDGRLSIHTHEIRLTQAHLPYQPVAGKRLPSTKHFAVFADRIVLDGRLLNPGRNIELNAREIVIEKPVTLDVGGAFADKDFAPGEFPVQKDARPGAAGTDGTDGAKGGDGGSIVINARRVSNKTADAHQLSVTELASIGTRIFSERPPKIDNAAKLARFALGSTKMFGSDMAIHLEDPRIEGFAKLSLDSASFDGTANRIGMRLNLSALTVNGMTQLSGNQRLSSAAFGCKIDAAATMSADGKIGAVESMLSLVMDKPIRLTVPYIDGILSAAALEIVRKQIAAHLRATIEAFLASFAEALRKAPLIFLAGGGRGGRGQDGRPGNRGETGDAGAKTSKHGQETDHGYGFPEEASGKTGHPGGQAGSPGRSGNGGDGGQVVLNVVDPVALGIIYGVGAGEGGAQASPGERGPGGRGGQGAMCKMFNSRTGRPVEDQAPARWHGRAGRPARQTQRHPGRRGQGRSADAVQRQTFWWQRCSAAFIRRAGAGPQPQPAADHPEHHGSGFPQREDRT